MFEQPGYTTSPAELQARLAAERACNPFLLLRDGAGTQRIFELNGGPGRIAIGRSPEADVSLDWDVDASRVHAELERIADVWTVADDGLSRNGTFVNGERVHGRRRLGDRDQIRCGKTVIWYRAPGESARTSTAAAVEVSPPRLSAAQRRVLDALARPFAEGNAFATAASNRQIAEELHLSVHAVKTHMRMLFQKFEVEDLPQNQKRARLVALALQTGQITERGFAPLGGGQEEHP